MSVQKMKDVQIEELRMKLDRLMRARHNRLIQTSEYTDRDERRDIRIRKVQDEIEKLEKTHTANNQA